MRRYEQAENAANKIIEAFKAGSVPKAMAPIFIHRKDTAPCRSWSWSNQLLTALAGFSDARGYVQWQQVKRTVKTGEKAFYILAPLRKTIRDRDPNSGDERERQVIIGFKGAPVFGFEQTDGEPLPPPDPAVADWLKSLPVAAVADDWGLKVEAYNGREGGALGWYRHGQTIALGVQNLSTWAHELIHAADNRLGSLTEAGQHWRSETVAELGGAILLESLGFEVESDRGGCWEYVSHYAKAAGIEPITACERVLKRACEAVALVLSKAEELQASGEAVAMVAGEVVAVVVEQPAPVEPAPVVVVDPIPAESTPAKPKRQRAPRRPRKAAEAAKAILPLAPAVVATESQPEPQTEGQPAGLGDGVRRIYEGGDIAWWQVA